MQEIGDELISIFEYHHDSFQIQICNYRIVSSYTFIYIDLKTPCI